MSFYRRGKDVSNKKGKDLSVVGDLGRRGVGSWDGPPLNPGPKSAPAQGHLPGCSWSGLSHMHVEREIKLTPSERF